MTIIVNSIRWRLLIWHGLIFTAVVTGFGFTAYRLEYAHRLRRIDDGLQERSSLLTGAVRPFPPPSGFPPRSDPESRLPSKVASLFEGGSASDPYYIVWLRDGRVQARSANAPDNVAMPERKRPDQWQLARTRGEMREFVRFTSLDRCLLTGRSISGDMAELRRWAWWPRPWPARPLHSRTSSRDRRTPTRSRSEVRAGTWDHGGGRRRARRRRAGVGGCAVTRLT